MGATATVIVLAAGQGKRMRSAGAKVLQPLCGRPMLAYVVDRAFALEADRIAVVVAPGMQSVEESLASHPARDRIRIAVQTQQRGTGDAVRSGLEALLADRSIQKSDSDQARKRAVVVLYGDMPCLTARSLESLLEAFESSQGGAALLTAEPDDPRGFGRVLRRADGSVLGIVEERDATPDQRSVREVNAGVYAFSAGDLETFLPQLSAHNSQGELYLTDIVGLLVAAGRRVFAVRLDDEREAVGVNTLAHLAEARAVIQERILEAHLAAGVRIEDPATTYIDHGVEIGPGTVILPCSVLRAGVRVGAGCEVGPFTHLRAGTVLHDGAEVGNFTECKQAELGEGTKAKHLSYLGDVRIGSKANIGAGTIVANYDGVKKHRTTIGDRAFVGSGSVLIAPTTIGEGALTGGGAVVTRGSSIPPGEVWVGVPARPLRSRTERQAASGDASSAGHCGAGERGAGERGAGDRGAGSASDLSDAQRREPGL